MNRAVVVDENFLSYVGHRRLEDGAPSARPDDEPVVPGSELTCRDLRELFESQILSRHIDYVAREMRARNDGFYTIGSAGHEGNALVGRLTRVTDLAFLHYRSGAFMAERARKRPDLDFIRDTMLGFAASSDDPTAGGRHKIWGSLALNVPPQTSTIASHFPKAVGAAMSIARARRIDPRIDIPPDMLVVCSFGDASVSHATAQTALNAAARAAYQQLPIPILFVCEDNGVGISVKTPHGWIRANYVNRFGLTYFEANGLDLIEGYTAVRAAIDHCRSRRQPVFLHLNVVRLLGHAGTDPETEYHGWDEIEAAEARDPLLSCARRVMDLGVMTPADVLALYERTRERVREAAEAAAHRPKLSSAAQIMAPLAPHSPDAVAAEAARVPSLEDRLHIFGSEDQLPEHRPARHLGALINHGLHDLLVKYPRAVVFGEDVAKRGGVYHVTTGLMSRFGAGRVFNTVLDETTILGLAVGAAHLGLLPIPEIQYLAYYHNAEDQIRGEACSLQYFSNGQFRNPMVIRIAGWGYQKGFGGHFHNDNSIAALRDVPGLVIATPSRGDDAVKMLRTCMAMATVDGRVIAFVEPIALYMTKDLWEPKDRSWSFEYPPPQEFIPFGEGAVYHEEARDLTIITFGNGVYLSLRAARALHEQHGMAARIVDLRWLNPLNENWIIAQAQTTGRVLVVDEGRRTGGINEAVLALLWEHCGGAVRAARVTGLDTYIPLGPAADLVLPSEQGIIDAALALR
ncbi:MAG: MFS transporter [Phycisphaerae bacterium]|nr:MFS transporter [Phycisphaerae bacterium]